MKKTMNMCLAKTAPITMTNISMRPVTMITPLQIQISCESSNRLIRLFCIGLHTCFIVLRGCLVRLPAHKTFHGDDDDYRNFRRRRMRLVVRLQTLANSAWSTIDALRSDGTKALGRFLS